MKKISRFFLSHASVLENHEMTRVVGGNNESSYSYFLRCYQENEDGYNVNDCSRTTAIQYCGEDLTDVVCVAVSVTGPSIGQ